MTTGFANSNKSLNVIFVVDRYAPEARSVAHLFEDLAKSLVRRGHRITVLTKRPTENIPDASKVPNQEVLDGVRILRMRNYLGEPRGTIWKGLDQASLAARVWLRLVLFERPDVVLVYSPPLPLAAACAATGVRMVLNLHDLYPRTAIELGRLRSPLLISMAQMLEQFVYTMTDRFVVPAPESLRYLTEERGIPAERVKLCYNWVDMKSTMPGSGDDFRKEHGLEGQFVVTYAGLVGIAQDLSAIIEAARIKLADPSIVFFIIGEGSELERWRRTGSGLPNLRFLPTLARPSYLEALRASDAGLLALSADLRSPAIPGKLQNLMALSKPVLAVVPVDSAAAKAVETSACGLISRPADGHALCRNIDILRSDPVLAARLGASGHDFAAKWFSLEHAVDIFSESLSLAVSK